MTEETTELRVEQRHRDAAEALKLEQLQRLLAAIKSDEALSVWGDDEGDNAPLIQAFARFERDLGRPAAVDADGVETQAVLDIRDDEMVTMRGDHYKRLIAARHTAQSRADGDRND